MKRIALGSILMILAGTTGFFITLASKAQAPLFQPYSIHFLVSSISTTPSGGAITFSRIEAQRGDGARATLNIDPSTGVKGWSFDDPANNAIVFARSDAKAKSTLFRAPRLPDEKLIAVLSDTTCRTYSADSEKFIGDGELAGVPVAKSILSQGGTTTETWYAPFLGCAQVYQRTVTTDVTTKAVVAIFERIAVSIKLHEPDPELYCTPEDYPEVMPSEMTRRVAIFKGTEPAQCITDRDHVLDLRYLDSQTLNPNKKLASADVNR